MYHEAWRTGKTSRGNPDCFSKPSDFDEGLPWPTQERPTKKTADSPSDDYLNHRTKQWIKMLTIQALFVMNGMRNFLTVCDCLVNDSSSDSGQHQVRVWTMDLLYGLGSFGCVMTSIYAIWLVLQVSYFCSYQKLVEKQHFHVLSHLKSIRHHHLSLEERKSFERMPLFVKWQKCIEIAITTVQMTLFHAFDAVMTWSWDLLRSPCSTSGHLFLALQLLWFDPHLV